MKWSNLFCTLTVAAGCLLAAGSPPAVDAQSPKGTLTGDQAVQAIVKGGEQRRMLALNSLRWNTPDDAAYTAALQELLTQTASRRTILQSKFRAVHVLGGSPSDDADATLQQLLSAVDWRLQMTAADALGERGNDAAAGPLRDCWNTPAAAENYALRHAIIGALGELRGTAGLDELVRLLPQLDGQLRYEAVARLTQRTGEDFGDNVQKWTEWQAARPEVWSPRPVTQEPPPTELAWNRTLPRFFRVPIYAKRVLFVVDMSGSMKSTVDGKTRLEATQDQLTNAIKALPDDALFGVIAFNDRVQPWKLQPMVANSANKAAAIQAVWTLNAQGRTAVNDALETALDYSGYLEQILLLSDGKPTAGRLVQHAAILNNITGRNQFRRVRIDTLGLDTSGESERLLQQLSERNHGQYVKLR
jgi:hypothetical protein